jgi:hypothetical protein
MGRHPAKCKWGTRLSILYAARDPLRSPQKTAKPLCDAVEHAFLELGNQYMVLLASCVNRPSGTGETALSYTGLPFSVEVCTYLFCAFGAKTTSAGSN